VWRGSVLPISTAVDREQIDEVLAQFADAITSGRTAASASRGSGI